MKRDPDIAGYASAEARVERAGSDQIKVAQAGGPNTGQTASPIPTNIVATYVATPGLRVQLAAGKIDQIIVVGNDVYLIHSDGSAVLIKNGVQFPPTLLLGPVEIPAAQLAQIVQGATEGVPTAGPDTDNGPPSSGGNFAVDPGGIGDGFPISPLLPPTALFFPAFEVEEEIAGLEEGDGDGNGGPSVLPPTVGGAIQPLVIFERNLDFIADPPSSPADLGPGNVEGTIPDQPGESADSVGQVDSITFTAGSGDIISIVFADPNDAANLVSVLDENGQSIPVFWQLELNGTQLVGYLSDPSQGEPDPVIILQVSSEPYGGVLTGDPVVPAVWATAGTSVTPIITVTLTGAFPHSDTIDGEDSDGNSHLDDLVVLDGFKLIGTDTNSSSVTSEVFSVHVADDAPIADLEGTEATVALDETLAGSSFVLADTNAEDESGQSDPFSVGSPLIAYAQISAATLFSDSSVFGADEAGTKVFSLQLNGSESGLIDSLTQTEIFLFIENDNVVGRVGNGQDDTANPIAFVFHVDATSGDVTAAQYRAVAHDNAGDFGTDAQDEADSPESIDPGIVQILLTVSDSESDVDTDTFDLGAAIKFEDDGIFVDVLRTLEEGQGETQLSLPALDESIGLDDGDTNAEDDDNPPVTLPSLLLVADSDLAIGSQQTPATEVGSIASLFSFTPEVGTDGENESLREEGYALTLTNANGDPAAAGEGVMTTLTVTALDETAVTPSNAALEGASVEARTIWLFQISPTVVVGVIGQDTPDTNDDYVALRFTLDITTDPSNPVLSVEQYLPVEHPDQATSGNGLDSYDEVAALAFAVIDDLSDASLGIIYTVTVFDNDGDFDSDFATVILAGTDSETSAVLIDDDGPRIDPSDDKICGNVLTYSSVKAGNVEERGLDGAGDKDVLLSGIGHNHNTINTANDIGVGNQWIDGHNEPGHSINPGETLRLDFVNSLTFSGSGPSADFNYNGHYAVDAASFVIAQIQGNGADAIVFVQAYNADDDKDYENTDAGDVLVPITTDDVSVTGDPTFTKTNVYDGSGNLLGVVITGLAVGARVTVNPAADFDRLVIRNFDEEPTFDENGAPISFDGDGSFSVSGIQSTFCTPVTLAVAHDESAGFSPQSGPNPENDVDPATAPTALQDAITSASILPADVLGFAKSSTSAATLFENATFGTDGPGGISYQLSTSAIGGSFDGVATGLTTTDGGDPIELFTDLTNPNIVWGIADEGSPGERKVFALFLDDLGFLWVAQFEAIAHDADGASASDHDDIASLTAGTVFITATITDGDGDEAYAVSPAGLQIDFQDDGLIAIDDIDSVDVASTTIATGNVVTALYAGATPNDANSDDGVADTIGADDFGSIDWTNEIGGVVTGLHGTLTVDGAGNYVYQVNASDPDVLALGAGESLDDEVFAYTITDGDGDIDTATLTITIFGTNDGPEANADTNWAHEDTADASGNVLLTLAHNGSPSDPFGDVADTDADTNDTLTVTNIADDNEDLPVTAGTTSLDGAIITGLYGTLTIGADGTYSYVLDNSNTDVQGLDDGETLTDEVFTYTVSDGTSDNTATLTITIFGTNDGPEANADTNWAHEDTADASGNVLLTLAHNGSPSDPFGDVADTDADTNDTLTVTNIADDNEDLPVTAGTTSLDGAIITGLYGTLTIGADGTYSYVLDNSNTDVQGLDDGETLTDEVFTYTVSDGTSDNTATLTITIFGTNDGPEANADTNWAHEDTADASGNVLLTLAHNGSPSDPFGDVADTDADTNDTLTVTNIADDNEDLPVTAGTTSLDGAIITGLYGTLTIGADGTYSYVLDNSNTDVQGLDDGETLTDEVFTYTVSDGTSDNTATLTITIFGTNDGPEANADTNWAHEDTADASGNVLLTLAHNGSPSDPFGDVADTDADTNDTLTVTNIADDNEDLPVTAGTTSLDGAIITGLYGTLTIGADGTYSYVLDNSNTDVQGLDDGETLTDEVFTYTVSDGTSDNTATLTITIFGTNDGPEANADTNWAHEDTADASGNVLLTLAHNGSPSDPFGDVADTDADTNDTLTVTNIADDNEDLPVTAGTTSLDGAIITGLYGTLTIGADGTYSYVLDNSNTDVQGLDDGETLTDEVFTYTVSDGTSDNTATLTITIFGTNDGPEANADTNWAHEDTADASGNVLLTLAHNGSPSDPFGDVADTDADTNDTLTVTNIADDNEDLPVTAGTTSLDGAIITGLYGTLTIGADGTYSYVLDNSNTDVQGLDDGETLTDEVFTYTVSDGTSDNTATLTITIFGTNDGPEANADTNWAHEDTADASGNVLLTLAHNGSPSDPFGDVADTDADTNDTLTVTNIADDNEDLPVTAGTTSLDGAIITGLYGTLTIGADGTYSYVLDNSNTDVQGLDDGETLTDEVFTYTVSDGTSDNTATLTITIFGTNDGPEANADTNWAHEDTADASGNVLLTLAHNGSPSDPFGDVADTDADTNDTLTVTNIADDNEDLPVTAGTTSLDGAIITGLYGTLTIGADGTYSYVLDNSNTDVQGLDDGETLTDEVFTYTVSDGTSDNTATLTITIFGSDDNAAPTVEATSSTVSEEGLLRGIADMIGNPTDTTNSATANGQVSANDPDGDTLAFTFGDPGAVLTSGGSPVTWSGVGTNQLIGMVGAVTIITITFTDALGNYTVDLDAPVDHASGNQENLKVFTVPVNVSDGEFSVPTDITITIEDDSPRNFTPAKTFAINDGASVSVASVDVFDNTGADLLGNVVFTGGTNGDPATGSVGGGAATQLTSNGTNIYLYGFGTDTLIGSTVNPATSPTQAQIEAVKVFTVNLSADDSNPFPSDNYTFKLFAKVDDGSQVSVTSQSQLRGGNNSYFIMDPFLSGPDVNKDVLVSATDGTAQDGVNVATVGIGVGDGQTINDNETARFDFVTSASQSSGSGGRSYYDYTAHYTVNNFTFTVKNIGQADDSDATAGNDVDILVRAYDANDVNPSNTPNGAAQEAAHYNELINDPTVVITQIYVNNIALNMSDTSVVVTVSNNGFVIRNLEENSVIRIETLNGYDRIEAGNAFGSVTIGPNTYTFSDGDRFDLDDVGFTNFAAGSTIDMSFNVQLTDEDGDTSTGSIAVNLQPDPGSGTRLMTGTSGEDVFATDLNAKLLIADYDATDIDYVDLTEVFNQFNAGDTAQQFIDTRVQYDDATGGLNVDADDNGSYELGVATVSEAGFTGTTANDPANTVNVVINDTADTPPIV